MLVTKHASYKLWNLDYNKITIQAVFFFAHNIQWWHSIRSASHVFQ
jgi:hypothetical protein